MTRNVSPVQPRDPPRYECPGYWLPFAAEVLRRSLANGGDYGRDALRRERGLLLAGDPDAGLDVLLSVDHLLREAVAGDPGLRQSAALHGMALHLNPRARLAAALAFLCVTEGV